MKTISMFLKVTLTAFSVSAATTAGWAQTTLQVFYASPGNYQAVFDRIAQDFQKEHPDIKLEFWKPAADYDEATPQLLWGSLTGQLPDVFLTGLNYLRVFKDRDLLVPLDNFLSEGTSWEDLGYRSAMLSFGQLDNEIYALPFAISVPVLYVNEDLVTRAGGTVEGLPQDWKGLAEFGQKITAQDQGLTAFFFAYDAAGNWGLQQLVYSAGGELGSEDGCQVRFDGQPGQSAFDTLETFYKSGMPAYTQLQVRQAFAAGTVGIFASSSAYVRSMEKAIDGKFSMKVLPYPRVSEEEGRLPAGGSVAVMLAKDSERQKAAWEFIKFATGPVGQTYVATMTGYMPGNQRALDDPNLLGSAYISEPNNRAANRATANHEGLVQLGWRQQRQGCERHPGLHHSGRNRPENSCRCVAGNEA